ncbi:peptidoglycan-binding protein [Streptomyces sp. RKAG293]|uniref:peptidoglycan-binding domain-containing protein n=1 Tax=Streptomyces sp. RKAG293 TaxID=2893403 RepID=UPI0020343B45|nr:peptidoglycan-binding protein [Streptomyces sp. RKAG293]MCM2419180.1 peptidoglycan-binding protein [Streptomyces sp. RKAG293]
MATAAARSAERQIALAATEGFHPLRVRPYVAEPGTEPAESTVKPLIGTAAYRPAATDVGMFPATGAGVFPATGAGMFPATYDGLEYPADDAPAYPAGDGPGHPADLSAAGPHDSGLLLDRTGHSDSDWNDAEGPGQHRGGRRRRPRRRRRGLVVAAATVAATAMAAGAVAVANQLLSTPDRPERALPDNSSSVPDVVLPTSDAMAAVAPTAAHGKAPTASPTATHRAPSTPVTTPPATVAPVSATPSPPPATVGDPVVPGPDATPSSTPAPTNHPTLATPALRMGDTGTQVRDLQQRLRRAYVYMGSVDGVFDTEVRDAVATFQFWMGITSDPEGVYGPATRTALERQTSW